MESLRALGLTKYEQEIYKSLLKLGSTDAKKIAEDSQVPPTAVYPNIHALVQKKCIQKIEGNPARYQALPPNVVVQYIVTQKEKELNSLKEKAIGELNNIQKQVSIPQKQKIQLTQGKELSRSVYYDAIKDAKKSVYIMGWKFEKIGDKYAFLRLCNAAKKRKIDIKIILTKSKEKNQQLIKDYRAEQIELRYLPLENFSMLIKDNEECKITLKDPEMKERINVRFFDMAFAKAMHDYFMMQWKNAVAL